MQERESDSYRCRDSGIWIIVHEFEILIFKVKYTLDFRIYLHFRQGTRLAAELGRNLLEMILIDMRVSSRMHEFSRLKAAYLSYHHGQEGIRGDVERHTEEDIGAALIKLA